MEKTNQTAEPSTEEFAQALRGGLRGRFTLSLGMLSAGLEALDDNLQHTCAPEEYGVMQPLLREMNGQLDYLRRLGDCASAAAMLPLLRGQEELYPMDLSAFVRELCELFNEEAAAAGQGIRAVCDLSALNGSMLAVMGTEYAAAGLFYALLSNTLQAKRDAHVTLVCAPGALVYRDDGPGLPPDARAVLETGQLSADLLSRGCLGLRLVREYAALLGWTVTTEDGAGCAVRFALPPCTRVPMPHLKLQSGGAVETALRAHRRAELRGVISAALYRARL